MNKVVYFVLNAFAILVALGLIIFTNLAGKIGGVLIIIGISTEYFSGRYKKYVTDESKAGEGKKIFIHLLPFIIIIAIIIFVVIYKAFT